MDWPSTLPLPQQNINIKTVANVARTDLDAGIARQTTLNSTGTRTYGVQWQMNLDQFEIFQAFFATDLALGTLYFDMPIEDGGGVEVVSLRFAGGQYAHSYVPHQRYDVSATLEREIVQDIPDPDVPLVPKWYQPIVNVTDFYSELTAADRNKLFICNPSVSGGQSLITQLNPAEDLTDMPIGIQLGANPASVLISNTPVNSPPLPKTDLRSTATNTPVIGDASTIDPNGDVITYSMGTTAASHGVVSAINSSTGAYTYTPNTGYNGADNFTIEADDGNGGVTQIVCGMTVAPAFLSWQTMAANLGAYAVYDSTHVTTGGANTNGDTTITVLLDQSGNGRHMADAQTVNLRGFLKTYNGQQFICSKYNGSGFNLMAFKGANAGLTSAPLTAFIVLSIHKVPVGVTIVSIGNGAWIGYRGDSTKYVGMTIDWTSSPKTWRQIYDSSGNPTQNTGWNSTDMPWAFPIQGEPFVLEYFTPVTTTTGTAVQGYICSCNGYPSAQGNNGANATAVTGLTLGGYWSLSYSGNDSYCLGVVIIDLKSGTPPTPSQLMGLRKAMYDQTL